MEINIFNHYGEMDFDYQTIVTKLSVVFQEKFHLEKSVSLILVTQDEIQKLNEQFRDKNQPTDVLSFRDVDEEYLGDVFICIDKVYEHAKSYEHSNQREFAFLLCHGLLHLLGYDHSRKSNQKAMFEMQDLLLDQTEYRRD